MTDATFRRGLPTIVVVIGSILPSCGGGGGGGGGADSGSVEATTGLSTKDIARWGDLLVNEVSAADAASLSVTGGSLLALTLGNDCPVVTPNPANPTLSEALFADCFDEGGDYIVQGKIILESQAAGSAKPNPCTDFTSSSQAPFDVSLGISEDPAAGITFTKAADGSSTSVTLDLALRHFPGPPNRWLLAGPTGVSPTTLASGKPVTATGTVCLEWVDGDLDGFGSFMISSSPDGGFLSQIGFAMGDSKILEFGISDLQKLLFEGTYDLSTGEVIFD